MKIKKVLEKSGTVLKRAKRIARRMTGVVLAGLIVISGTGVAKAATLADVFDAKQYADAYPDLKEAYGYNEKALLNHYLTYGIAEGRVVGGLIDVVKYRAANADLDAAFGDDWDAYVNHFITYGANEGRDNFTDVDALDYIKNHSELTNTAAPKNRTMKNVTLADIFNAELYADKYPDVKAAFGYDKVALLNHYLTYGIAEGRETGGLLDIVKYREAYPDLDAAFGDNWNAYVNHFLNYGVYEGRDNFTDFNALDYMERYSDLKEAFGDDVLALYQHYETYGKAENREARSETVVAAEKEAAKKKEESTTPVTPAPAPAPEDEETYDFGGAVIRVSMGHFSDLNTEFEGSTSYDIAWNAARQIEEKYNVKFEYVNLEWDYEYSDAENILRGINNGEAFADVFCLDNRTTIQLKDYLADITNDLNVLQVGSLFTEAGTWNGHTYGWTYENLGDVNVLVYSRDYLKSIGMDVTPTDKFLAGEWSYPEALSYFAELQAKLPTDTYCISVYPMHWAYMSSAPNGVTPVSNNGTINLTSKPYIDALNFYRDMIDAGVAYPPKDVAVDDYGIISEFELPFSVDDLCKKDAAGKMVLGVAEVWQMWGLYDILGDWGIVPFPWSPDYTTATGDYTTLSNSYTVSQLYWTNVLVPKAEYRSADAAAIDDIMLHKIVMDYIDLKDANGAANRHAMWAAEQAGGKYVNWGSNSGASDVFTTQDDAKLFDWLHTRVALNHGYSVGSYVRIAMVGYQGILVGDVENVAASYAAAGEAALKEAGLK